MEHEEDNKTRETEKNGEEETITIKLPVDILEFTEFYAKVCDEDEGELIRKVLIERLSEIRKKLREIPHMTSEVIWREWDVS